MSLDKYIQDGQDLKVVEKIHGKIVDMLTHGEALSYIALQKKPAVTLLPDSIAISNKRIFLCEFTKLGLATNFEIFSWKDIKDIAFKEEIFGSKVTVIPFTGENLSIDYIPKTQARKLYQLIKEALENVKIENEQPKREITAPVTPVFEAPTPVAQPIVERPVVVPEETKAEPAPVFERTEPSPAKVEVEEDELTLKLKKLKGLFDKQLISQAEYESKKAEILSQL